MGGNGRGAAEARTGKADGIVNRKAPRCAIAHGTAVAIGGE